MGPLFLLAEFYELKFVNGLHSFYNFKVTFQYLYSCPIFK